MTINAAFNSGIINTAVNGAVNYADAQYREQVTFDDLDKNIQDIVNKIESYDIGGSNPTPDIPTPTTDPTANWDKTKVDLVESADNVVVPVPKGFVASKATGENTVENGFVIYQGTDDVTDSNKDTAMTTRNQFVWVPVADTSKMFTTHDGRDVGRLYNFDKTSKTYTEIAWSDTGYREPDVVTGSDGLQYDAGASNYSSAGITGITNADEFKTQLETEFAEIKTSVEKYHGFYIGRYETGSVSTAKAVTVKGNSDIANQTWYKHYQMNKDMIKENGIKSSMIWGSQWDQTMIWFDTQGGAKKDYVYNSTGKGHYSASSTTTTGSSTAYAVNNIYDMAGTAWDWTLEADLTNGRLLRGGSYHSGSNSPASCRGSSTPTRSDVDFGSRSTLIM